MNIEYSGESIISNKNSGLYLSKQATASAPIIDFGNLLEKGKYYTLIMHDPDAVNDNHNVNHWVITNIQLTTSNSFESLPLHKARQGLPLHKALMPLLDYKGPNPPDKSGIHKYIFTLYLQPLYLQSLYLQPLYLQPLYLQPDVFKLTKEEAESELRQARLQPLLVKLGLKDAKIIDQVFFTSSFSLRKGGRKTRRKKQKKRKRGSRKFRS